MSDSKKVLLVGDEGCGKTGLIFSYFSSNLPDPDVPIIYKEYKTYVDVNGTTVPLELWIAPVQDYYSEIRQLSYENNSAVILCFAIDDPVSFANAEKKWYAEIRKHLPDVPVVLVGNKSDLRSDENVINRLTCQSLRPVTFDQGKDLADRLNVYQYIECSAKINERVEDVFEAVATAILKSTQ